MSSMLNGFATTASPPDPRTASAVISWPQPVMNAIVRSGSCWRSRLASCQPVMPGMPRSVSTRSKRPAREFFERALARFARGGAVAECTQHVHQQFAHGLFVVDHEHLQRERRRAGHHGELAGRHDRRGERED